LRRVRVAAAVGCPVCGVLDATVHSGVHTTVRAALASRARLDATMHGVLRIHFRAARASCALLHATMHSVLRLDVLWLACASLRLGVLRLACVALTAVLAAHRGRDGLTAGRRLARALLLLAPHRGVQSPSRRHPRRPGLRADEDKRKLFSCLKKLLHGA